MPKSLIVISSNTNDQSFAEEAALGANFSFLHFSSPERASEALQNENLAAVFVDVSNENLYRAFKSVLLNSKLPSRKDPLFHFLCPSLENASYLARDPILGNIIRNSYPNTKEAGQYYSRILKFHQATTRFDLSHFLRPGTTLQTIKLEISSQKQSVIDTVRDLLQAAQFQNRISSIISNAVDELLMNAIFDAPIDDENNPVYQLTARSTVLKLEGKASVEMRIGFDGDILVLSAVDYFGSLNRTKLLNCISKSYVDQEYQPRNSEAGAGVGLFNVCHSGGSLLFACEPGVKTEVMVLFRKTEDTKSFKNQFRFVSTIFYG